jgi:7-cyano-7-deazaguanine synthase
MSEEGKVLLLLSGGLDSSVLLNYLLTEERAEVVALFFDRNQSNVAYEREAAERISREAGAEFEYASIRDWRSAISKFEGPGKPDLILAIPRNAIMVFLSTPFAAAHKCTKIALGISLDDATTEDSNAEFVAATNALLDVTGQRARVVAPFLEREWKKEEIVRWAVERLGRDFIEKTRSCYKSSPEPCGTCSACIKREVALEKVRTGGGAGGM